MAGRILFLITVGFGIMSDENRNTDLSERSEEMRTPIEDVPLNTIFDLLAHRHRRIALKRLLHADQALPIEGLATKIAEIEAESAEEPEETVQEIKIMLSHIHIPKLAANDMVAYDDDQTLIDSTEKLNKLEPFLSQQIFD